MPKLKIFLSGGGGFFGRNFLELYGENYNIAAPSHKELDLLDSEAVAGFFKDKHFDVVIHAANIGGDRKGRGETDVAEKIIRMLENILAQKNNFKKIIFLGSGAEYGKQNSLVKVSEEDFGKTIPADSYGFGKYIGSRLLENSGQSFNLRCFGVFGKYEDYLARFISNAICFSLLGKPIVINQNAVFDYVYVKDLAKIVSHFIESEPKEKFYNAGTGSGVELLDLAKIVKDKTKNPFEIQIVKPGLNKEYTANNQKLMAALGHFKFTPLEQAIEELIEWYKENWQNIEPDFVDKA